MGNTQLTPEPEIVDSEQIDAELPYKVVLYNDDWHTFEEVINQIIKAVHCSVQQARNFTFEVHLKGKAIVYHGDMASCLRVSSVLEEIALHTQILG